MFKTVSPKKEQNDKNVHTISVAFFAIYSALDYKIVFGIVQMIFTENLIGCDCTTAKYIA